jgi:transposase
MEDRRVAAEVRAMTRKQVILMATQRQITWIQAADILGISARHMSRLKVRFEKQGWDGIRDHRGRRPRRRRIGLKTIARLCALYARRYQGFSVQHFYEQAVEHHGFRLSYTWTRLILQDAGLVAKAPARGKYRRKRERRPLVGMLVHLDTSTHAWLPALPMQDLVVALDDADGRILYARFWPQEGTASTFAALEHVVRHYGRFAELYTDRGSHFCHTASVGGPPDLPHATQVQQALRALGIRHILARSPEARGRSERAFGTIQGRLPAELRLHGITDYAAANLYLTTTFVPAFNRRFTVRPAQPGSAFVPVPGLDLRLVLSARHDRVVGNDSTVRFGSLVLQLPPRRERLHYVRCPVLVHEFADDTLGLSYQGRLLARYDRAGRLLEAPAVRGKAA